MGKVRKLVLNNFWWKVFSLFAAIVLWFVGMNMHDPTIVRDYSVKLSIRNKEKVTDNNFVLLNEKALESSTVTITYRGRRSAIESLDQRRADIVASIDLSPIDISNAKDVGEPLAATVTVELPTGANIVSGSYERVNVYPPTANIELDYLARKDVDVNVSTIGKTAEGYVALSPAAEPAAVRLTGARTLIDAVASVKVEVELDGTKTEDYVVTEPSMKIYNAEGREITEGIAVEGEDLFIQIPIRKYAEIEILRPFTVNPDQEHYEIASVEISPEYAQVIGTEEEIAALPYIALPSITVGNTAGLSYGQTFDLRASLIDTKLSIKEGTPQEVQVTVTLSEIVEREFLIEQDSITVTGVGEGMKVFMPDSVAVTLRGATEKLDGIADIAASLDLTGVEPGEYTMPLILAELPTNVTAAAGEAEITLVEEEPEVTDALAETADGEEATEEQTEEAVTEE